jgi:hypothetical protein
VKCKRKGKYNLILEEMAITVQHMEAAVQPLNIPKA